MFVFENNTGVLAPSFALFLTLFLLLNETNKSRYPHMSALQAVQLAAVLAVSVRGVGSSAHGCCPSFHTFVPFELFILSRLS